ncbi:hypothetical protein P171DRAFT_240729 [Karstenula rhodostoma CBS 690.94]|uniref:Uncharacterized protein n=1 Tax=Karstenula rhodostoma CBS 690.94 TaxID=1392251 RepID=A0A9P4PMF3_9PLEO|nr:hypothetical protein P171DRAFT_240729 [Karstenula rhodostoma CBS 690.94]
MFSKIKRTYRIAKNYQKNTKVAKQWDALHAMHKVDFALQYIKERDRGETDEATPDDMQTDDDDWMAVEHIDPSSELLGSPNAEVFKADTGFNVTIENAHPSAKLERKPKLRATHEVDGFAVIKQGQAFGQFEQPSHVNPNRELQHKTPRGETKKVLREWGSPATNSTFSLPLLSRASADNGFSSCLYGTNANVSPMGGSVQTPAKSASFWFRGTQAATSPTSASPTSASPHSLFSTKGATSVAHTFSTAAVTVTDNALQAAGVRGEETYSDSDDDFSVDENGRPLTGSPSTTAPSKKERTPFSSAQRGMAVKKRPKFSRR